MFIFTCGLLHLKDSLKNIEKIYKLKEHLFRKELEQDEFYDDTCKDNENE